MKKGYPNRRKWTDKDRETLVLLHKLCKCQFMSTHPSCLQELDLSSRLQLQEDWVETAQVVFPRLQALRKLDLQGNNLSKLPPRLFEGLIDTLEEVVLSLNLLVALPPPIAHISGLKRLILRNNNLFGVLSPDIGRLSNLRQLVLDRNQLSTLPLQIGQLKSLQSLSLATNSIASLPKEIGLLSSLQVLNVAENCLSSLPVQMAKLRKLQRLNLSMNELTCLPGEIVSHLREMKELNISYNQLDQLPPEIGLLVKMRILVMRDNDNITSLPFGMLCLSPKLHIDMTNLRVVPSGYIVNPSKVTIPKIEWWFRMDDRKYALLITPLPMSRN